MTYQIFMICLCIIFLLIKLPQDQTIPRQYSRYPCLLPLAEIYNYYYTDSDLIVLCLKSRWHYAITVLASKMFGYMEYLLVFWQIIIPDTGTPICFKEAQAFHIWILCYCFQRTQTLDVAQPLQETTCFVLVRD